MTNHTTDAATWLADLLARENAALAGLDLPRAAALLTEKQQAVQAFADAQAAGTPTPAGLLPRLCDLARENHDLLEHAIAIQSRVIGIVARAIPTAQAAPRYGATGALASARPAALTLSARV